MENLTKRETEVLYWIAEGFSNKEIAKQLIISPKCVEKHLHNIFSKLDVNSRTKAIKVASAKGLIKSGKEG